jgi:VanZ family protein
VSTSRAVSGWLPVVAWAALIFALSSIPHLGTGLGTWDTILRKGAHVTEYAVLGVLLVRAIGRETPAFLLGVAYAATDEIHQHFVSGRHSSPIDVAIDSTGVLLGILVFRSRKRVTWQRGIESDRGRAKATR